MARNVAIHRQRVSIHKRDVAIGLAGTREVTFQFGIAAVRGLLGTDEHGTTSAIVRREAELLGARAEAAGADIGPGSVAAVSPVGVCGSKSDAFGLESGGSVVAASGVSRLDCGDAVDCVRSRICFEAEVIGDEGVGVDVVERLGESGLAQARDKEKKTGLVGELHGKGRLGR